MEEERDPSKNIQKGLRVIVWYISMEKERDPKKIWKGVKTKSDLEKSRGRSRVCGSGLNTKILLGLAWDAYIWGLVEENEESKQEKR